MNAENRLFSAQLAGDVDELNLLLHDDLIALLPNGQLLTKEMDLQAHRTKSMTIDKATFTIEEIKIVDDTAITLVSMKAEGKMQGAPLIGTFKYLRVWKQKDHFCKVVAASILQLS